METNRTGITAAGLALEALLEMPKAVADLQAQVHGLRLEIAALRQTLPPPLVTVADAANRLGVTKQTVRRRIAAGDLRAVKVGGSVRVDLSKVNDLTMNPGGAAADLVQLVGAKGT